MAEIKLTKYIVNDCVAGHFFPDPDPKQGYGRGEQFDADPENPRIKHALAIGLVRVAEPAKAAKE